MHTNVFSSFQWEPPALQRHLPQILQKSPIEAAGQIYKIEQLTALQPSSFQVTLHVPHHITISGTATLLL